MIVYYWWNFYKISQKNCGGLFLWSYIIQLSVVVHERCTIWGKLFSYYCLVLVLFWRYPWWCIYRVLAGLGSRGGELPVQWLVGKGTRWWQMWAILLSGDFGGVNNIYCTTLVCSWYAWWWSSCWYRDTGRRCYFIEILSIEDFVHLLWLLFLSAAGVVVVGTFLLDIVVCVFIVLYNSIQLALFWGATTKEWHTSTNKQAAVVTAVVYMGS